MRLAAAALALLCAACATAYSPESLTGGYDQTQINENTWRIVFAGNGYTTRETVQTFWLYRAAELTLLKGYDGFEIITPVQLVSRDSSNGLVPVQYIEKPIFVATIRMLKKPIVGAPPRVFDARALEAALEDKVKHSLCSGNVCPHVHTYLMPPLPT